MVQQVFDELARERGPALRDAADEVDHVRGFAEADAPEVDGALTDRGLREHQPRSEEDLPIPGGSFLLSR